MRRSSQRAWSCAASQRSSSRRSRSPGSVPASAAPRPRSPLPALSPVLLGPLLLTRFDLLPAALAVGALAAVLAGRDRLGSGALGLGSRGEAVARAFAPALRRLVATSWRPTAGDRGRGDVRCPGGRDRVPTVDRRRTRRTPRQPLASGVATAADREPWCVGPPRPASRASGCRWAGPRATAPRT